MMLLIDSFNRYVWRAYYVPVPVLSAWGIWVQETDQEPCRDRAEVTPASASLCISLVLRQLAPVMWAPSFRCFSEKKKVVNGHSDVSFSQVRDQEHHQFPRIEPYQGIPLMSSSIAIYQTRNKNTRALHVLSFRWLSWSQPGNRKGVESITWPGSSSPSPSASAQGLWLQRKA